ncbi:HlyD family type I secretion periplasmic adaptor subunit [Methylobacterium haplocladii]|uniref:Membrane fusion protein (MFP) family protein n=1 Tax=Methylobacterium haplocladii TaxID=1176176 RepID=A0A512IVS5_9HYPH|nr:HlyD family type I secretion periplasmic adaptor subunit [Methylobacterium haplocladii]GEP01795.1 membrane-fusion protein [Methylobacterium haplocladii]GJD85568.1 Leukotoxin export protein LtxD [Methylobacterium haplocladii]GLS60733.1 membrane-fusion protein [Methylobacterium haplocladii]
MAGKDTDAQLLRFESETAEIREAPEPIGLRITTLVMAAFLTVGIVISAVARVDRVVTSERGRIIPSQGTILFQALDASIIKTLDVREGEQVKEGKLLATLDPTFASADVDQATQQLASLDAQIARASAEQANKPYEPTATDPKRAGYEHLQKRLFDQRAAQRNSQIASFDAKIAQTQATIKRLEGDEARYSERERISGQIEGMRQQLVERQAGSLLNLLIASDARLEMMRTMESGRNALVESRQQLGALQADRDAFLQQWLSQSSQDLVTAQGSRDTAVAQLSKAARRKDLVQLYAPSDAVVLTRSKVSVGSVLREGDTLMTLVALDAPIEAEIAISASQVGFVRAGDPVTLKVDAFNFVEHGFAEGHLNWISEGSFSLNDEGQPVEPYYKARTSIDHLKFVRVPAGFRLIPGMTLSADVHIGDRSVLAYIITGAAQGMSGAMREP